MSKIKDIYEKHKVVIKYLVFGVITTVVSFSAFYICLWVATEFFGALEHGKDSTRYLVANIVANIIKWCAGVLTAFFTNKKWVFNDADNSVSTPKQLLVFAEGRVLTLVMALILQYLLELLFAVIITKDMTVFGLVFTAEIIGTTVALVIYSVIEIIANYYFSKLIVFKKKKDE
ncbi:MAG: GtrA family protein [Clostridia bacterium]|nr:GtrA family protein [Clostridia bacterium]